MGEKVKLCVIGILFLSLLGTSACVSKSAYDEVQANLVQTQQEKASLTSTLAQEQGKVSNLTSQLEAAKAEVSSAKSALAQEQGKVSNLTSQLDAAKTEASSAKSALAQEQGKVSNLTSQLEAAKADVSRLQNPVRPILRYVNTTAEVSSTGQFTEKTIFKRGEAVTVIVAGVIPVHDQKFSFSARLSIQDQKTSNVISFGTLQAQGEASPEAATVTRSTWRRFDTQSWESGQYRITAQIEDVITGALSQPATTTFTIQ